MSKKISDVKIEEALIELDKFLQITNPVELGIFKIKIGKKVDRWYYNKMIMIVSDVLNNTDDDERSDPLSRVG